MIRRGEVYFADLDPTVGREQAGRRPVLVVSDDEINQLPLVVTVVLGTSSRRVDRDYPVNVRVPAQESGLPEDTVFLCFQIRSIDRQRLGRGSPAGRLPKERMEEVSAALARVLSLDIG